MSRALQVAQGADRERTADRLLKSSADKFYDPDVDIDWSAPPVEGKVYQPEHRISLYGTALWDRMSPEQRLELGRHEIASVASNGIWFEVILMQMLLKDIYRGDPTTKHVQYALTEIADECRHSTMFGRAIGQLGLPAYGPRKRLHRTARLLPTIGYGPALYGSVLIVEEILDRWQREAMADENVQPLIRMINRIHVLEEARHVTFARQEVASGMSKLSKPELAYQRWLVAMVGCQVTHTLVNPRVYAAVGLDPSGARHAAMNNPHYQESVRWAGERIMAFLSDAGLVGRPGMHWWHRSFLLAKP
ncbi:MAG TPA: diiron oxygenase [Pseudonocardiaceae bacterium]|nr:diiron oxygenase [Pseudonocardiaceae bacterium]